MARIEAKRVEIHILHAYLLLFGGGGVRYRPCFELI